METVLNNGTFQATIATKGAELISLKSLSSGTEYIWQRDPEYWKFCSPVLFPIVGKLKDDVYYYEGKQYSLPSHGFARHSEFELIEKKETSAVFRLKDNEETFQVYPFHFCLDITYQMTNSGITVAYSVKNSGTNKMFFSIGAHPAFNVPFDTDTTFSDYKFDITPVLERERLLLDVTTGLIDNSKKQTFQEESMGISRELFKGNAVIVASEEKETVTISSDKTQNKIRVSYNDFSYLGIWSMYPKESPFVCIEPWCGLASNTESDGNIETKKGINTLAPEETFQREYMIEITEA